MSSQSQNNCPLFAFPLYLFIRPTVGAGNLAGFLCTPPGCVHPEQELRGFFGAAVSVRALPSAWHRARTHRSWAVTKAKEEGCLKEGRQHLEGSHP